MDWILQIVFGGAATLKFADLRLSIPKEDPGRVGKYVLLDLLALLSACVMMIGVSSAIPIVAAMYAAHPWGWSLITGAVAIFIRIVWRIEHSFNSLWRVVSTFWGAVAGACLFTMGVVIIIWC